MERHEQIKETFERNAKAMSLRPSAGRGTATTRVTVRDGLTCDVEDGAWKLTVDMSQKSGGDGRAPDPGVYGRTALGACLAIGYQLWGAKLGVVFTSVKVEVQADYDSGGYHGVADVTPGYAQMRYIVSVESDAPEADIRKAIDEAEKHSPYLDNFTRAIDVRRELKIVAPENQERRTLNPEP